MALVNIRRDVSDDFYRYKMERLQTKIEGKGNGIKTVVVNLPSVAQSLARPGAYVIKFFGFELGAQTNMDPKDDRWIINGAHDSAKLQDHLDGFINKFVLCKKCKNPETDVVIKDSRILLDCKACGQRSDVDLRLKLSSFILKNQPKKSKKDKAERKAARKAKQNGNANGNHSGEDGSENGSNENGSNDGNGDADSDDEFQKMQAEAPEVPREVEVKEHEWAVDMSEAAVKARQAQLPDEFKQKLSIGDDEDEDGEGGGNTVYDELGNWILQEAEAKGSIDNVDSIDIYVKAKDLGIEAKHRTVLVLVQTLFNENICAQIPKRTSMLKQVVTSDRHEKALLGGTERLVGSLSQEHPTIIQQVTKILQLYYVNDLISEEVVTKWGTRASKKYTDLATSKKVRKAAEPFLTWLEEADEESSEEED
ncbi:domain found in IF2B/IF5-domain-containing protein [Stachybotrys elegans]|uniref:Domain found in IF2B/IF5-domain-containing protein n=1 Tax=Stachybotrys elegans TaxID=80388 RepID=A0A8K0SNA1_9HYPO|nr:domain found in IF2B/IF5-domain-containing protein [Stachybotrys elegans]